MSSLAGGRPRGKSHQAELPLTLTKSGLTGPVTLEHIQWRSAGVGVEGGGRGGSKVAAKGVEESSCSGTQC